MYHLRAQALIKTMNDEGDDDGDDDDDIDDDDNHHQNHVNPYAADG